jgi:hypothetical protein
VRVVVRQEAPACRRVGHYTVRAPRGANVLRVPRRVGEHRLRAGTYRFVGSVRGVEVLDVRLRLTITKKHVRAHRDHLESVCSEPTPAVLSVPPGLSAAAPASVAAAKPREGHGTASARESSEPFLPPVLRRLNPADKSPLVRVLLFALLAGAIALLGAGSLPERRLAGVPVAGVMSRRRPAITVAGVALLVAAALVMLLA